MPKEATLSPNVSPIFLSLLYAQKTHQKEVVLPILTVKLLRVNSV